MYMYFLNWRFTVRLEHYSAMSGPYGGGPYYLRTAGICLGANAGPCSQATTSRKPSLVAMFRLGYLLAISPG
jgi:hypothetical protein